MQSITPQIATSFVFGLAFVITLIVLAAKFPHPSPFQYNIFRSIFALAGAGVAAMVPGFIDVRVNTTTVLLIRAGGALAVFVILFFFNPARLLAHERGVEPPPRPDTLPNGRPFPEVLRENFNCVWNALRALDRAGENLWNKVNDQTLGAFADRRRELAELIDDNALFFADADYEALEEVLRAADFYLGGKESLAAIRNGTLYGDRLIQLAGPGEKDRLVDSEVRRQIIQNRRWLTRYRNVLKEIRSRFHKVVAA